MGSIPCLTRWPDGTFTSEYIGVIRTCIAMDVILLTRLYRAWSGRTNESISKHVQHALYSLIQHVNNLHITELFNYNR